MLESPDVASLVYKAVSQIPKGMVSTYGDIASALGDVKASRAVGEILSKNPTPIIVPCHRVVYADGRVGWYKGKGKNSEEKISLLASEGIRIKDDKIEDFSAVRFKEFQIWPILQMLREEQENIKKQVIVENRSRSFDYVVGLDVSYSGENAFGVAAVYDMCGELCEIKEVVCKVRFPYIPTYLSYREMPVFSKLTDVKNAVYLVDGHGLLHPRIGVASQLGVVCGVSTIGAAKTLLHGHVDKPDEKRSSVTINGDIKGIMLRENASATYVSVGHHISLKQAEEICARFLCRGIPLPLRTAHNEATRSRKRSHENLDIRSGCDRECNRREAKLQS